MVLLHDRNKLKFLKV